MNKNVIFLEFMYKDTYIDHEHTYRHAHMNTNINY